MIYLVTYQFNHHYAVSGYNRLAEFVPCRTVRIPRFVERIARDLAGNRLREKLTARTGLTGYFPECLWLEMMAKRVSRRASSIVHFIYPENSYFYTGMSKRQSNARLVATYHQPPEESRAFILKTDAIRRLDAVILLSENQREFFEPLVGNEKIFVVPHGIDRGFFSPASQPQPGNQSIVAVGNWLRDFRTLRSAFAELSRTAPDILCNVVSLERNRREFADLPNVRFYSQISDGELRSLYRQASASVLCLTGAAANNALLESLACGLPLVATDLPAVREYTPPEGCVYVPREDPACLASAVVSVLRDGRKAALMGRMNREWSARYDWTAIARRTMEVYRAAGADV